MVIGISKDNKKPLKGQDKRANLFLGLNSEYKNHLHKFKNCNEIAHLLIYTIGYLQLSILLYKVLAATPLEASRALKVGGGKIDLIQF